MTKELSLIELKSKQEELFNRWESLNFHISAIKGIIQNPLEIFTPTPINKSEWLNEIEALHYDINILKVETLATLKGFKDYKSLMESIRNGDNE